MNLQNVKFPAYAIRSHEKIWEEDFITYIKTINGTQVLDNKNLTGATIGIRRLKIPEDKKYKLKTAVFSFGQLLKHKAANNTWIDDSGTLFKLNKKRFVPLKYKKVKNYRYVDGHGILVDIQGYNAPLMLPGYFLQEIVGHAFIGVLEIDGGYLFYELSDTQKPDTRRKI